MAPNAVVLHVSTAMAHLPYVPGYAAYQASKLAAVRVFEHFGVENREKGVRVVHYHPGLYRTEVGKMTEGLGMPFDEIDLAGAFAVWAASGEADFLDGRFVWAAWDVDALKGMRGVLEGDRGLFTIGLVGFPGN